MLLNQLFLRNVLAARTSEINSAYLIGQLRHNDTVSHATFRHQILKIFVCVQISQTKTKLEILG